MRASWFGLAVASVASAALAACGGEPPQGTGDGSGKAGPAAANPAAAKTSGARAADADFPQDGHLVEAAVGETIELLLEAPLRGPGTNWKADERGEPVLRPTRIDFRPARGDLGIMVWTYEAVRPGETSIRFIRTEGPNGPEIEARTIRFRVR